MGHNPNQTRLVHNHNKSTRANETIGYFRYSWIGILAFSCYAGEQQHKLQGCFNTWKDGTLGVLLGQTRGLSVS